MHFCVIKTSHISHSLPAQMLAVDSNVHSDCASALTDLRKHFSGLSSISSRSCMFMKYCRFKPPPQLVQICSTSWNIFNLCGRIFGSTCATSREFASVDIFTMTLFAFMPHVKSASVLTCLCRCVRRDLFTAHMERRNH